MSLEKFFSAVKKFFREDVSEVVGAYFDGEKIFVVRLTEKFETVETEADASEVEHLAEKISLVCKQKNWRTSAVGLCLREEDAVTYQTVVGNLPEKEIPAMVKSWALAQAGKDAVFSFAKVGSELWMETLPRTRLEEIYAAFGKFGLNLRGLSVMPADLLTKVAPFDRTEFITEVVREKKAPNLLAAGGVWNWKKFSQATATIFLAILAVVTFKTFWNYGAASDELDAAKFAVNELREDVALKKAVDADIAELHRLNKIAAAQVDTPTKFNLLMNLGKIADKSVRLTKIRADGNSFEIEGVANSPDAIKNYLSRVKSSVVSSARLESSSKRDDELVFSIRATL